MVNTPGSAGTSENEIPYPLFIQCNTLPYTIECREGGKNEGRDHVDALVLCTQWWQWGRYPQDDSCYYILAVRW